MKLTSRGKRLVVGLVLLLGFGIIFLDLLLLAVVLFGAAFLVYDLGDAIYLARGGGAFRFEPAKLDEKAIRGADKRVEPTLRTSRAIQLDASSAPWLSLGASSFAAGEWPVDMGLSSELAGSYASEGIPAEIKSRYGIFSTRMTVPLDISLRVYPRFIATALAALEFLMRSGAGTEGEVETSSI
ncbi:MAG: hypothetical protein KGI38_11005, partial [Thaumarchaeota archaeon]|nr:hypothetical protein [Nitrososphaerota archaeon]